MTYANGETRIQTWELMTFKRHLFGKKTTSNIELTSKRVIIYSKNKDATTRQELPLDAIDGIYVTQNQSIKGWKLFLANLIIFTLCFLLVGIFLRQKILDAFTDKNYYIYVMYNRSEYPLVFVNHKASKERRSFFEFLSKKKKASNNATGQFKYAKLHRSTIEDFDSTFISKLITAKEQARA